MPEALKVFTKEEWKELGAKLFGEDILMWKFQCPSCGNIQRPIDFKPYKDKGAAPGDAYFNCIGRFTGTKNEIGSKDKPCNYTLGGLLRLSNTIVETDGNRVMIFDFAKEV
jgi:hypothetical protein